jgi:cell division protein FtsI/penicillin-binding protein 2
MEAEVNQRLQRLIEAWCGVLLLLLVLTGPLALRAQSSTLFGQGAQALLEREFGRPDLSWLLLDRSGAVLAQRWEAPEHAIPPGSLLKPFVAAAYAAQHEDKFPRLRCAGTRSLCWLPRGHGELGIEDALARSCNAYFLALAADLDRDRALQAFRSFGLAGPGQDFDARTAIGLGTGWRESPLALAHAYLALLDSSDSRLRSQLLTGMEDAASQGTATAVDALLGKHAALAKTGTARCTHRLRAQADGFAVILLPAAEPRYLLLLRMHGVTGAQTAAEAAQMFRALGLGRP